MELCLIHKAEKNKEYCPSIAHRDQQPAYGHSTNPCRQTWISTEDCRYSYLVYY